MSTVGNTREVTCVNGDQRVFKIANRQTAYLGATDNNTFSCGNAPWEHTIETLDPNTLQPCVLEKTTLDYNIA